MYKHIKKFKGCYKGFTLAEVLVTLLVIGVIASITIPVLLQNVNNATYVARLKEMNSILQQTFIQVNSDNAGDITSLTSQDPTWGGQNTMNAFLTKMKYTKNCGSSMGCWYSSPQYSLNGTLLTSNLDSAWNGHRGKAILFNGDLMSIEITSPTCQSNYGSGPLNNATCGWIDLDVNGMNGPNTLGRDHFSLWLTKTGIYARGSYNDSSDCNSGTFTGDGCSAKVIKEDAMNY